MVTVLADPTFVLLVDMAPISDQRRQTFVPGWRWHAEVATCSCLACRSGGAAPVDGEPLGLRRVTQCAS